MKFIHKILVCQTSITCCLMNRILTANAMSLSSITATVRSKGVACPKGLTPVRGQVKYQVK